MLTWNSLWNLKYTHIQIPLKDLIGNNTQLKLVLITNSMEYGWSKYSCFTAGEAGLGPSLLFFSVVCFRIGNLKPLSHWRNLSHCRNKMFLILASDFSTCRISLWCRGEISTWSWGCRCNSVEQSLAGVSLQAVVFCYCSLPLWKLFCSPYRVPQPSVHQHLLENFETATVLSPDSQIFWTNGSIVGLELCFTITTIIQQTLQRFVHSSNANI